MPGLLTTNDRSRRALAGALLCGARAGDGRLKNVRAELTPFSGVTVFFDVDAPNPDSLRVVVSLDGKPSDSVAASEGSIHLPTLGTEDHALDLRTQRLHFEGFPDVGGDLDGRRLSMRWTAATASDLRAYRVYRNDGAGGSTYTLMDTLDEIQPAITFRAPVTSGSGTGTLTVGGSYSGAGTNSTWRVLIGSGVSTFQVDPGTGSYGAAQTFYAGVPVNIADGLTVTFNDDAALYAASDRYDFRVGPPTRYVSAELEPGTYLAKVSSVDAAGNESALSSAATISIDPAPKAPMGLAVTYSGGTFTATWTDPDDADLARVRLYTNYSEDFEALTDEVIFDSPVAVASPGDETVDFAPATTPDGTWRFVARSLDDESRESANFDAVSVVLPTSSVGIGVPFNVTVTPAAGGTFVVAWQYAEGDGETEYFDVYVNTSSSSPVFVTPLASPAALNTGGVYSQDYTTGAYSHGAVRYFTIRARNATTSLASINTDLTAGTADATAPSAPTGLAGLAQ